MTADTPAPVSLLRAAWLAFQQGDVVAAEVLCRRALSADPAASDAFALLGAIVQSQGRHQEAEPIFSELTRRDPGQRTHWINLGTVRRALGQLEDALAAYARAAALGEVSADFYYNVGLLHADRGDPESARAVLEKARRLAPADAEICFQYAQSCFDSMRSNDAVAALEQWPDWQGLTTELVAKVGLLLLVLGEARSAQLAITRAASDPSPTPLVRLKLAQVYERTNRLDAASAQLSRLKADARSADLGEELLITEAQFVQRTGRHDLACEAYMNVLKRCRDFRLRHIHLFPYAKSLDALGRYDEAFQALTEAHRSQSEYLDTSAAEALTRRAPTLAITRFGSGAQDLESWRDDAPPSLQQSPIFIVAFPRSGTTLLEQSLDAHPLLSTMDEQPFLQNAIDLIMRDGIRYPEALGAMSEQQLREVRDAYWQLTRRKVHLEPGQRLIDKNPLNMLRLPAIRRLFPNAPILLAIRHPCDVVLSCFMQHFTAPEFASLCRDLPTLASAYRQAFDFWYQEAALLQPRVREIRYETFVADFENEVRGLSTFLGLPWNDAMLAPAEHARSKGFISTPSYSQVVQPVNRKSVDRWRSYERHFLPVLPVLQPYLDRWRYEGVKTGDTSIG